jgi:hypothetical protein
LQRLVRQRVSRSTFSFAHRALSLRIVRRRLATSVPVSFYGARAAQACRRPRPGNRGARSGLIAAKYSFHGLSGHCRLVGGVVNNHARARRVRNRSTSIASQSGRAAPRHRPYATEQISHRQRSRQASLGSTRVTTFCAYSSDAANIQAPFDQLVYPSKKRRRNSKAKFFGGPQICNELELRRLFCW